MDWKAATAAIAIATLLVSIFVTRLGELENADKIMQRDIQTVHKDIAVAETRIAELHTEFESVVDILKTHFIRPPRFEGDERGPR